MVGLERWLSVGEPVSTKIPLARVEVWGSEI